MEEGLIMEIWDMFKEYIPDKNKEMAANQFVDFLLGKDLDAEDLEGLMGYDTYLDTAIKTVIDEESEYSDEAEDDYGYNEDEDY
jgi:hypothetical protein